MNADYRGENMQALQKVESTAVAITPMTMLQIAVEQNADLDKLQKLMELQERWEKNEARKAFNEAFAMFKSEAVKVIKNKAVTAGPLQGKSYAELFSVVNAVTPILSQHGLSISWKQSKDEKDWIEVTCQLRHIKGHSEEVTMGGPPDSGGAKNAIQARASTITYLQRYTLKAICGVAEQGDDTDGRTPKTTEAEPDAEGKKILEACGSIGSLKAAWGKLSEAQRKTLQTVFADCRKKVQEADNAAG